MTAAAKLAHRHTATELAAMRAALLADPASRLPTGRLRPAAARRERNLRYALLSRISDDRQRAALLTITDSWRTQP